MCGITGFIGKGTERDLSHMVEAIKHRGPDRQGTLLRGPVGLAQARLSIIDLSPAGNQPMVSADDTVAIAFNGEIYNFARIRQELESTKKYRFKGNSDTEVILYAYQEYGLECFSHLNGMFAIALYDFKLKRLVLARDRMGKKPLYWGLCNGTFLFGSELKALMKHPQFVKKLDLESLNSYLLHEYVPTPRSIFEGISKLPPATYLVYDGSKVTTTEYWAMDFTPRTDSFDAAVRELDSRISHAVKSRLVSDVPLGVFLSGGLDSSTIAYYAQKHSPQSIKTFSIGFDDASFDESDYARQVAEHLKTDHHHRVVHAQDSLDAIPEIYYLLDEPIADQSIIPTYLLSQFAREHVTVALGGDGGDELFAGYPTFQAEKVAPLYKRIPRVIRRHVIEPLVRMLPTSTKYLGFDFVAKRFISGFNVPDIHRHAAWLGNFHRKDREQLFKPKIWDVVKDMNEFAEIDTYENKLRYSDFNSLILHLYQRTYMMDGVMVKVDRASMMHGLEARAPFLDYEVVDYANSLPYSFKHQGMTGKYILKKLMEGKLPKNIIYRTKKGFAVPTASWLRGVLRPWCDEVLSRENITSMGLFDVEYIDTLKQRHYAGTENNHKKLWTLIVFVLWYKRFMA